MYSQRQRQSSHRYSSSRYYTAVQAILLFFIVSSTIVLIIQAALFNKKWTKKDSEIYDELKTRNSKGTKISMMIGSILRIISFVFIYLFVTHRI